jgi:hypothetical protein
MNALSPPTAGGLRSGGSAEAQLQVADGNDPLMGSGGPVVWDGLQDRRKWQRGFSVQVPGPPLGCPTLPTYRS